MVAAVTGLVLSGCGNESGGGTGNPPPSPAPSSAPTVTQSTPVGTRLPLTVSRTGGFAGFDDPVLRTEAAHAGALYLVKPIESQRLLDLVAGKPDTTSETARNPAGQAWTRPSLQ